MLFFDDGFLRTIMDAEWEEANGCIISADDLVTQPICICHVGIDHFVGWVLREMLLKRGGVGTLWARMILQ